MVRRSLLRHRPMMVNGHEIAYERSGRGAPVLLIHGLGSNGAMWRLQVQALAPRYDVIAMDVRGHGESARPPAGYSMPELAGDAAALVRALGVAPVHVVGLSLGGLIAFQLAVDHPTLVRSLSIVNSGPAVVPRTAGERFRLGLRVVLGPARLGRIIAKRLFPRPDQEPYRRELVASMASHDRRAYDLLMRAIVGWSVSDRLDAVRSPVLAVSGDRDYTPVARKEKYVRRLHDARLVVIPESGHATPLDQPAPFNASLLQFLESIP